MRVLVISLALILASGMSVAAEGSRQLTRRVDRQIDFAQSQKLCYAPIVFENTKPTGRERAIIATAAKKRGWSLIDGGGSVVNVKNNKCTFLTAS